MYFHNLLLQGNSKEREKTEVCGTPLSQPSCSYLRLALEITGIYGHVLRTPWLQPFKTWNSEMLFLLMEDHGLALLK